MALAASNQTYPQVVLIHYMFDILLMRISGLGYNFNVMLGRLIREVEPDLMDGLIQASKDGDMSKFQSLYCSKIGSSEDDVEEESGSDDELEIPEDCINTANRWFDGLINRDMDVSNEIYSVRTVEFDCQELRKLVREVYTLQDEIASEEAEGEGEDKDLLAAKKSLACFLREIAKQLPSEQELWFIRIKAFMLNGIFFKTH